MLPPGVDLHARPAADFVRAAMGFGASIQVGTGEREADAKSLLSVLALGAKGGTEIRLTAVGDDADAAITPCANAWQRSAERAVDERLQPAGASTRASLSTSAASAASTARPPARRVSL